MSARNWWTCPSCNTVLGEIKDEMIVIKHRPIDRDRPELGHQVELEIPATVPLRRRCDTRKCRRLESQGWVEYNPNRRERDRAE